MQALFNEELSFGEVAARTGLSTDDVNILAGWTLRTLAATNKAGLLVAAYQHGLLQVTTHVVAHNHPRQKSYDDGAPAWEPPGVDLI